MRRPGAMLAMARKVATGCLEDGLIHAGNLAYLSMLAIFPFFITGAAIFALIGDAADRAAMIGSVLATLPPPVAEAIGPAAIAAVEARHGWLLWVGGLFGLWTVGSLIETIRDILRRAYRTRPVRAFWRYRLGTTAIVIAAVLLLLLSLLAQVALGTAQQVILNAIPELRPMLGGLGWSRLVTALGVFVAVFLLLVSLTPAPYRGREHPKWPGALLVSVWWLAVSLVLPPLLAGLLNYNLTYGSLAGVMIALFFFWLVGLGMVAGVELNAALARRPAQGETEEEC